MDKCMDIPERDNCSSFIRGKCVIAFGCFDAGNLEIIFPCNSRQCVEHKLEAIVNIWFHCEKKWVPLLYSLLQLLFGSGPVAVSKHFIGWSLVEYNIHSHRTVWEQRVLKGGAVHWRNLYSICCFTLAPNSSISCFAGFWVHVLIKGNPIFRVFGIFSMAWNLGEGLGVGSPNTVAMYLLVCNELFTSCSDDSSSSSISMIRLLSSMISSISIISTSASTSIASWRLLMMASCWCWCRMATALFFVEWWWGGA